MHFLTKYPYRYLLCCSMLLAVSFSASTQNIDVPYQAFTVNEGLPQNYLLGLVQDSTGFIWIGTKDGLARYDGYHFKIYRHGKDSLHTPAANNITNLYVDHHGNVWIQYDNRAIDCYNPATGIFDHVSKEQSWNAVRTQVIQYELILDHHDQLWFFAENGLYHYNIRTKKLAAFSAPGLINDTLHAIMEDHAGKIWIATQKGFTIYDYATNKTRNIPYLLSARRTYSGRNYKLGLGEMENGRIVVTSLDSNVLVYDPVNNSFQKITAKLKHPLVYDSGLGNTDFITANNGDRWFTVNGRIFRIDRKTNEISEVDDPSHPLPPDASALLIDRSGTLWLGKNAKGLYKINLNASRFVSKKYSYPNFETDILVTELGVPEKNIQPDMMNSAFSYMFRNITDTAKGIIWIQNYLANRHHARLFAYDINQRKLITNNIELSKDGEVGMSSDPNGNLWLVGINSWSPVKLTYQNGKLEKQLMNTPGLSGDSMFLKAGRVAINPVVDNDMMWVMPSNMSIDFGIWNLLSINLKTKQTRWYVLKPDNAEPSSSLLMMINDPSNPKYLWIGTTGNGLLRFDKTTGECHAFTTDDGLPNNTIYAIVADNNHHIWLSSNRGITRFNLATHAVRNFDVEDGLISNEFNRWHCFKLPDDRIAFGGITGYTIFNPADIRDDEFQSRVLLSNLLINNKIPDSSLFGSNSLNALPVLELPYDQNFLAFEFTSDEYNSPKKISYRYRLSNFDNDWVYTGNERFANYTKLPPGKYTLEINASNISGIWSSKIKTLSIIINPPWWRTWWAYTIYCVLVAALVISFFYYRLRRIKLRQEMILQQQQTDQLKAIDEMKTRFFSNITHEFRTPLSLIISPVEKLQSETTDKQVQHTLSSVQKNANRLLQLINQLLDLSKLEAGSMSLNFSRGRLDEFAGEVVNLFSPLAESKQVELSCECDLSREYLFEADKLKTVLINLLSNAVKFTPAGGRVTVSVTEDAAKKISIAVNDSGIGIAADKLPFIFNRFFQVDDSRIRSYEGTGIGLALVKELVELMGGTVSAESNEGRGTTITVLLPVEKAGNSNAPVWKKESVKDILLQAAKRSVDEKNQKREVAESNLPVLLLVEDNEELLSFLRESFERNLPGGRAGFRVLTASDGLTAFQLAKEELPDVVISDVMMPVMDGYSLCHQLKTDAVTNHIAVILLTAKISYESRLNGLQLGADDYINKPFHFDELETRIRNLFDRQEKQRNKYRAALQHNEPSTEVSLSENPFLKNIYAIIDEMIDDTQLGASKLAEKNAMSLRTLNRKLNAMVGLTAGDLIRQYRLQKSLVLLKEGRNVSEAAYMVGFETPAYFSQCFKDQYGVSPSSVTSDN